MRIRQVKSLVGGETLVEPVITKEKEILISGGTVLKPEYLDLISFLGIDTVCIEDPYEAFETTHFIISEERKQYYVSEVQKNPGKSYLPWKKFIEQNDGPCK